MIRAVVILLFVLITPTQPSIASGASNGNKAPRALKAEEQITVRISSVVDGDTLKTTDGRTIRIWGIDTPERGEHGYWTAGILLETFVGDNGKLTCRFIEKDRYRRDVMQCKSGKMDIGAMMVKTGWARDYSRYSDDHYQAEENAAKTARRGIWRK